jgi:hypothetical protein
MSIGRRVDQPTVARLHDGSAARDANLEMSQVRVLLQELGYELVYKIDGSMMIVLASYPERPLIATDRMVYLTPAVGFLQPRRFDRPASYMLQAPVGTGMMELSGTGSMVRPLERLKRRVEVFGHKHALNAPAGLLAPYMTVLRGNPERIRECLALGLHPKRLSDYMALGMSYEQALADYEMPPEVVFRMFHARTHQ